MKCLMPSLLNYLGPTIRYRSQMSKTLTILRHNPITNHFYVHSDGQVDWTSTDHEEADREVARILSRGKAAHDAWVSSKFKNTRQARKYCLLRGEGSDHELAMAGASR